MTHKLLGLLFVSSLSVLLGCSENPKTERTQITQKPQARLQNTQQGSAVQSGLDVLIVVDNSSSMRDKQENLRDNIDLFIEGLQSKLADGLTINFAVVSGEMPNGNDFRYADALRQINDFTRISGAAPYCFDGPMLVQNDCPWVGFVATQSMLTPFITLEKNSNLDALKERILLGASAAGNEAVGLATLLALHREKVNPTGFLRPEAHLAVVGITDAAEHSLLTATEFRDDLLALKDGDEDKIFSVLVFAPRVTTPTLQRCPGESDGSIDRLMDVYSSVKNHQLLELCSPTYGEDLTDIGEFISDSIASNIVLEHLPIQDTIEVFLNGTKLENDVEDGWAYKPFTNTLKISQVLGEELLGATYEIVVKYEYFVIDNDEDVQEKPEEAAEEMDSEVI